MRASQLGEQATGQVQVAPRLARIVGRATERQIGATQLQTLAALRQEQRRGPPQLDGLVASPRAARMSPATR